MLLDKRNEFADAVTIPTAIATGAILGDVIPLSTVLGSGVNLRRDIGAGEPVSVVINIDTAVTASATSTLTFRLVTADNAALSTNQITLLTSKTFLQANMATELIAGSLVFNVQLPLGLLYREYLGVVVDVAAATLTTGKANAFLALEPGMYRSYNDTV